MAESPFIFTPGRAAYTVTRRSDGVELGEVRKYTENYNLRRSIAVRGWQALTNGGVQCIGKYPTRAQAAEALSAHTPPTDQIEAKARAHND